MLTIHSYQYQYFDNGSFVLVLYNSLVKNSAVIMQMNIKTLILYEELFMIIIHSFTNQLFSAVICSTLRKQHKKYIQWQ